jgi:hypothetical protein
MNKNGDTVTSAVTSLDLHDMARLARTYGVADFFVVTPLVDQQELVTRILDHWTAGAGGRYNPKRREALSLVRLKDTMAAVTAEIAGRGDGPPRQVVTSAQPSRQAIGFGPMRELLGDGRPTVLVFGTAWGLAPDFMVTADAVLAPIRGTGDYNHLAVRSAAAIVLDRLLGRSDPAE